MKIVFDASGYRLEGMLVNTWERDPRGDSPRAVVQTVDPDSVERDPLTVL